MLPTELKTAVAGGRMLLGYDISLTGSFRGSIEISFPVGTAYEGQVVTILHYVNGRVETYTAVVENGLATITVNSLSPFVILATGDTLSPPNTGDATPLAGVGLMLMGLAGISLIKKRKLRK